MVDASGPVQLQMKPTSNVSGVLAPAVWLRMPPPATLRPATIAMTEKIRTPNQLPRRVLLLCIANPPRWPCPASAAARRSNSFSSVPSTCAEAQRYIYRNVTCRSRNISFGFDVEVAFSGTAALDGVRGPLAATV